MSDIQNVLDIREKQYGSFLDKAEFIQYVKYLMRNAPSWESMMADQQEAADMIIHKLSRIIYGNPDHLDSWLDISGYSELIVKRLEGESL